MWRGRRPHMLGYGLAVIGPGVALLLTLLIAPLREHAHVALFLAAVLASAWYGGLRPGLIATAISLLVLRLFLLPAVSGLVMVLVDATWLGLCVLAIFLINTLKAARQRAEDERNRLHMREQTARHELEAALIGLQEREDRLSRLEQAHAAEASFLKARDAIAEAMLSSLQPEILIPQLLEAVGRSQGYTGGFLWRVTDAGDAAVIAAAFGEGMAQHLGLRRNLRDPGFLAGQVIRSGQPAFIDKAQEDLSAAQQAPHLPAAQAYLALPLSRHGGGVLGALVFADFEHPERFAEWDLHRGAVLASQVAQALALSERFDQAQRRQELLQEVTASLHDPLYVVDSEGRIFFANAALERLRGASSEELLGQLARDFFEPSILPEFAERRRRAFSGEPVAPMLEAEIIGKDGTPLPVELSVGSLMREGRVIGRVVVVRDITTHKRLEEQLKASLQTKEALLKEVHHRVKNNLQVISSLLDLQADAIIDPHIRAMFEESQNRIHSMALIHENLYQSDDLSHIDAEQYIRSLSRRLFEAYSTPNDRIALTVDADKVSLNVNTAIPYGLILNELISNCLKHAFPDERAGEIRIELRLHAPGTCVLKISDTGVGFPDDIDFRATESFGLQMVCILTEQLGGTIELDRGDGTTFTIAFPV
jgi:PAS domain S-box-containing protein